VEDTAGVNAFWSLSQLRRALAWRDFLTRFLLNNFQLRKADVHCPGGSSSGLCIGCDRGCIRLPKRITDRVYPRRLHNCIGVIIEVRAIIGSQVDRQALPTFGWLLSSLHHAFQILKDLGSLGTATESLIERLYPILSSGESLFFPLSKFSYEIGLNGMPIPVVVANIHYTQRVAVRRPAGA